MTDESAVGAASRQLLPTATTRQTWAALRAEFARLPGLSAAATILLVAAAATGLVAPWVLGRLVDDVIAGSDTPRIVAWAGVIAGAALLAGVLTAIGAALTARLGETVLARLRERVLDRALHLPSATLERAGTGDLVARAGDDVAVVTNVIATSGPAFLGALLSIVLTALGLFALDWRLGLAGLAAAPAYALALRWYLRRSVPYYARERVATGERTQAMAGALRGAATVRAYRLEDAHVGGIADRSAAARDLSLEIFNLHTRFGLRMNRSEFVGLAAVLLAGFMLVRDDLATVGAATTAALYFHRLFNPIGLLLFQADAVLQAGASLARLVGVTTLPVGASPVGASPDAGSVPAAASAGSASPGGSAPGSSASVGPAPDFARPDGSGAGRPRRSAGRAGSGPAALEVVVDRHRYDDGPVVLRDVVLSLAPGERVALVGASGAGKSTLAGIAAGIIAPARGAVSLRGVPLGDLDEHRVRREIALISQEVHVFAGTLGDDLRLADPDATDAEVTAALDLVGVTDWLRTLPDGLDTCVGEGGRQLTAAQAQQLALARLVLADPAVAVLDEATAEAGSAGARDLERAATAATEGRTTLIVAHRLSQAATADRVVVLEHGRIVEHGTHEQLLAAGGGYSRLWRSWRTPVPVLPEERVGEEGAAGRARPDAAPDRGVGATHAPA
ncbi:ABC transporter ATP-binding protein [Micromonospora echinofusca]|uniref:ABC transporter ATP-binding protein n=1 Tax=Micromonospora echinofusca TaxID=47858 RepID=UPI00201FEF44|nr:ABC transporter ATP-binding protein [Micromonospora sp. MSM11]MCL7460218.1 ABC transporter ATP-binding protein/permease [Micromonospora sp. MSM11]